VKLYELDVNCTNNVLNHDIGTIKFSIIILCVISRVIPQLFSIKVL